MRSGRQKEMTGRGKQALHEENFLLALGKPSMYKLPFSPVADWPWTCRKPGGWVRKSGLKGGFGGVEIGEIRYELVVERWKMVSGREEFVKRAGKLVKCGKELVKCDFELVILKT